MSGGRRRFRIIKEIAEGGFGKVYLAEQISSDGFSRIVAVKLLHAKWSSHDEVVQRTRDEARLLGLVRHQHIVKVEDLTSIDGKCAIVMEYLEGVDLKWMTQFLKDRNEVFPRAALFEIILAVASALDAAYNSTPLQGGEPLKVIHRDIKPSNIFVTVAGGVKVLDFGTARANFAEREAKTQALAFGSQGYMAPERMLGEEDTPAADIFSLGITLYELLTLESFGRIPPRPNKFQKKIEERVAAVKLEGEGDWCDQVRDTLRLMLSYDPKDRPTATQLIEIMELLAQEANDMGLRRYCRTLVAEAKAALPDPEAQDPLAGSLVDEDASAGSGVQSHPTINPGEIDDQKSGPQPTTTGRQKSQPVTPDPQPIAPPAVPAQVKSITPAIQDPGRSGGRQIQNGDTGGSSTPWAFIAGGGVGVVLLAVGAVLALLVVVLLIWWWSLQPGTPTVDPVPVPIPVQPVQPPPRPVEPAPAAPTAGGRVTSPDGSPGPKTTRTTLTYTDAAGGEVKITGPGGFKAEWDGKAPFDVGPLGAGQYAATVTAAGGQKFRLKRFVVEEGKASCTFAFDPGPGEWTGGCK